MKYLLALCLLSTPIFCDELVYPATVWWVDDVLYIECDGHIYYSLDHHHSVNCHCKKGN